LGRLQFQLGEAYYLIRAFRHRETRAVVVLSEDGVRYRADGSRAGLAWSVGEFETKEIRRPDKERWGVYAIAFPRPIRTIEQPDCTPPNSSLGR
jgi:hypothetical protein